MDSGDWLLERSRLTAGLYENPYDLELYLERAVVYEHLGFSDLAVGDAYRALLLTDEVQDDSGEYHRYAVEALRSRLSSQKPRGVPTSPNQVTGSEENENLDGEIDVDLSRHTEAISLACLRLLSRTLTRCGCLKSAYDFCTRGHFTIPDPILSKQRDEILAKYREIQQSQGPVQDESTFDPKDLPDYGSVRRELYPWNTYEPDRFSEATLRFLNAELSNVAPKCHVQAVSLPLLTEDGLQLLSSDGLKAPTVKQLGIFAKDDIGPGETVLDESSILTANNRLYHPLCDACSSELPNLESTEAIFACDDCDDTVFCSESCLDLAMDSYHPAVCGRDVEAVGKDTDPREAADALYLLLLSRVMAMAETQEAHPLELKEVKYIWGDLIPPDITYLHSESASAFSTARHLPFSFTYNILSPLHILEKMDVDIFASLPKYDTWILNTLYAKFRGNASARLSKHDGRPEVCAVHPIWCLANHSCDPNVEWEWGGNITFTARQERVEWGAKGKRQGDILKGEEVLNHYCDIDLGVRRRREWAVGALGGMCVCERCVWEEEQLKTRKKSWV